MRSLCKAPTAEAAKLALDQFRSKRDERFPAIGRSWEAHWESATPFFDCPEDIGKVICAASAGEPLNSSSRKISRNRNLFPTTGPL